MKNFFGKCLVILTAIFVVQIFFVNVHAAQVQGIPSGGKGATEVAAIEDMKLSAMKRVLAQITERSDDPASPYQQLLIDYRNFIRTVHVEKRNKISSGVIVTGKVEVNYPELQAAFGQLVKNSHGGDFTREVYVFVRVVADTTEDQIRQAENLILQRYMTRLRENKFVVANADEVIGELNQTRLMNFAQFVEFVKRKSAENPAICTAVIGEIRPDTFANADGYTASCAMNILALDCLSGFRVIENYEGREILRMTDLNRVENFLCEKAAVTSSKSVTDSLVKYWAGI